MSIFENLIIKLKRRLLSVLVSHQSFTDRLLGVLQETRPSDIASVADPKLVVKAFTNEVIGLVIQDYGCQVINALSDNQAKEILERMCESRLLDVVTAVNSKSGGTFKYVGNPDIRVIIGSGPQRADGWLATDINELNIIEKVSWQRLFNPASIDRLLAEHVLEHLTLPQLRSALANAYKYMKFGGFLRLAVPDAFHPSRYYYNLVKPGGWETSDEHLLFLDYEILSRIAGEAGFKIRLLEYFDEAGIFHSTEFSCEDGDIQRRAVKNSGLDTNNASVMARFYDSIPEHLRPQFHDKKMTYTSLIADLVKQD